MVRDSNKRGYFASIWRVLPRWLQKTTLFVGFPAWLLFFAMILTGQIFSQQMVTMTAFAVFGAVAAAHTFFIARAVWRNEI